MSRTSYSRWRSRARAVACALLMLCALPLAAAPTDVILLLDNSGSMRQNDPAFLLKSAVSKFVSGLPAETHAGIIIFDTKVNYAVKLGTLDVAARAAIKHSLDTIDYRGQYTNIPAAMERAIFELKNSARKDANKVVVFMTDGIVDTGNPAVDGAKTNWLREELSAEAAESGIRIFGIAFTEDADFFLIQSLAKKTSGEYFRALKPADLDGVFTAVELKLATPPPAPIVPAVVVPPPAPAPVAPAVPVLTACLAALPEEERAAIEEMAAAAKVPAEQMCKDGASSGGVVQIPAPASAGAGVALIVAAAIAVLAVVGLVIVVLRKRRPAVVVAAMPAAPKIPEAFIKDINRITNEPAMQLRDKPVMIGRVAGSEPDQLDYFVIDKATIGRRHALIKYRDFSFWMSDQGSVNGTFLNGERIENERPLKHGDRIRFHKYEFEFTMPEMDSAGHTVFADPSDRTMIAEGAMFAAPAAVAAVAASAVRPPSLEDDDEHGADGSSAMVLDRARDDGEAPTALSARQRAADDEEFFGLEIGEPQVTPVADDDDDMELATVAPMPELPRVSAPARPSLSGTVARADAEFNAEASAFFDEDDLGLTDNPPTLAAINRGPSLEPANTEFDDEATTQFVTPPRALPDDFGDAETLLPGAAMVDEGGGAPNDVSLDEFMRTDSFDVPEPAFADDGDEQVTLLPEHVRRAAQPDIEDVFDVTAEGTIPPVRSGGDDDDDALTQIQTR